MTLRIVSWNINSVRIRLHLIKQLVELQNPDIICLQEIKATEDVFPFEAIRAMGFPHIYVNGQKGYHGVAILSKVKLDKMHSIPLLDADQKRHIAAVLPDGTELHNFYVPAGGDIPDRIENPYFGFKLDYVDAMREWFGKQRKAHKKLILVGDLNIAPLENDVWSHKQLLKIVSHTPEEVEKLKNLQKAQNWADIGREHVHLDQKLYTWWSYRNQDWRKSNRGRRLDHIWTSPEIKEKMIKYSVLVDARDWEKPSDHVPVIVDYKS